MRTDYCIEGAEGVAKIGNSVAQTRASPPATCAADSANNISFNQRQSWRAQATSPSSINNKAGEMTKHDVYSTSRNAKLELYV